MSQIPTPLVKIIDYTNLKSNAHRKDIDIFLQQAIEYKVGGVCISPGWVYYAKQKLSNTDIKLSTVPNWKKGGGMKNMEGIGRDVCQIVDEVDYIWDIGSFLITNEIDKLKEDLIEIRRLTPGTLKVIIESSFIRLIAFRDRVSYEDRLQEACDIINKSGADWIKTDSTLMFRPTFKVLEDGSTLDLAPFEILREDVQLMKKYCSKPIKAAGGIRTSQEVFDLVEAGAGRIGTSSLEVVKTLQGGK